MWLYRHFITVMRRHELTKNFLLTHLPTYYLTKENCILSSCMFPNCIFPNSIFTNCISPNCIFSEVWAHIHFLVNFRQNFHQFLWIFWWFEFFYWIFAKFFTNFGEMFGELKKLVSFWVTKMSPILLTIIPSNFGVFFVTNFGENLVIW